MAPPFSITTIDHLVLTVRSIPATVDFYTKIIGMKAQTFTSASNSSEVRHALAFGPHKINLHQAGAEFEPKAAVAIPGSGDLCFITETPVQDALEAVKAHGVEILENGIVVDRMGARGPIRSFYIRDPDGNLVDGFKHLQPRYVGDSNKVQHHYFERSPRAMRDREYDPYVCELKAYQRLKESGICDRGIVPQYYGTIKNIDWQLYQPHLDMFASDPYAPNAIILEYVQNAQMLNEDNYTTLRMENFLSGIKEIHKVSIEHSDPATRNMMVVDGDPERAVWIDFDRAQTFERLRQQDIKWIEFEFKLVVEILEEMQQLPNIPINPPARPGPNTRSVHFNSQDIKNVRVWREFTLATILWKYQNILSTAQLPADPIPLSPARPVNSENAIMQRISELVCPRIRRALRAGFRQLAVTNQMNGLVAVSFDIGEAAAAINRSEPDMALYIAAQWGTGPNRAPGELKSSWKWQTNFSNRNYLPE
ncbi:hypothetical protein B7463_g12327, partial [Scytalidium lignicola]